MDLLSAAVANNVGWCARVCGSAGDTVDGVWRVIAPPPLYPDAVTVAPGTPAAAVLAATDGRAGCSVKDSFADVDLTAHGFDELFTAAWVAGEPVPARRPEWDVVHDAAGLRGWCAAAGLPATLPVALLDDPSVRVLQATADGAPAGGAVVTLAGGVAGLSNVFGRDDVCIWHAVRAEVATHFPNVPVVGYECGADLDAARAAGFRELGPLRVWLRA